MGLLDDKVAIITGAGNGLGRAYALRFAAEGARVVVNDVAPDAADAVVKEIEAAGGQGVASHHSVANAEDVPKLVELAVETFGRIDVLVNNAGIVHDKTFMKMDDAMWDDVVAVQLKGTFLVSRAFAKHAMNRGGGGRIVNTTSVSGMLGNFGQANYAAANAGVYGLTRTMAIELQKHRITVNALAPIAKTRMTEDLPTFQGVDTMTPEHVAPAAVFLASDLCGDKTGHVLAACGARMYAFKIVESAGKFKDGASTVWTPQEIAEHWSAIVKV